MRENRPYGSEGGEAKSLPYPYRIFHHDLIGNQPEPNRLIPVSD
jgi:hypothetical protein